LAIKNQAPVLGLGRYKPIFETLPCVNTAAQLLLAFIVTEPSEQSVSPVQPENTEPVAGTGMSATTLPWANSLLQLVAQFISPTLLVIVPVPVPDRDTFKAYEIRLKEAEQDLLAFIFTKGQSASPLQPVNVDPVAGTACKPTTVPVGKLAEHLLPQSIPAGELMILPLPLPAVVIVPTATAVRLYVIGAIGLAVKVAVQLLFALIVTEPPRQSGSPVQANV
jgi:hypothetical protein